MSGVCISVIYAQASGAHAPDESLVPVWMAEMQPFWGDAGLLRDYSAFSVPTLSFVS